MAEIWKPVPGFGGYYEASSIGRIRSIDRVVVKRHCSGKIIQQKYAGRLLKPCKTDDLGHMGVHLGVDGRKINVSVHRMVLFAFVGEPSDGQEACHNNGNASDNRIGNLRWDTHKSNNGDRIIHGTYALGENHAMAKLTEVQVVEIRKSWTGYADVCRRYGISKTQAHRIRKGDSWRHV